MFIAMNRFRVRKGAEAEFEAVWLDRDVKLRKEPGFVEFHMLRGPEADDHRLYVSHTIWASQEDFVAWTKGEAFREAHKGAGSRASLYIGGPQFEGFEVIQTVGQEAEAVA
ncbi:antibiotic biosynthesis monooxygenase family protein [Acuticoccus mangrovi]|uniref:Antibiotic biosynthesis monooxygenase n=1 Tax=Acuticoccus mangrovi TaxID=2796142 RepID=A0A934IN31_9HYPH|nr:antibiotic biosynthesis monooxygenase [Acuticoccus mangrovi]MBJ3774414.1 antibiotic biosynthesis monooxygenase [Acuticoccus mangrovi]